MHWTAVRVHECVRTQPCGAHECVRTQPCGVHECVRTQPCGVHECVRTQPCGVHECVRTQPCGVHGRVHTQPCGVYERVREQWQCTGMWRAPVTWSLTVCVRSGARHKGLVKESQLFSLASQLNRKVSTHGCKVSSPSTSAVLSLKSRRPLHHPTGVRDGTGGLHTDHGVAAGDAGVRAAAAGAAVRAGARCVVRRRRHAHTTAGDG
jgi:hypothetical protein